MCDFNGSCIRCMSCQVNDIHSKISMETLSVIYYNKLPDKDDSIDL